MKKILSIIVNTTGDLAFTFAGFAVVFYTLSGDTRRMATIAMATACVIHYTQQIAQGMNQDD
jgi:hypothetical protein